MRQDTGNSWKLADLGPVIAGAFKAILNGELLLKLNIGRYFVHILYAFLLLAVIIWVSLMTESSMAKVEKNKEIIKELEIIHSDKTYDVVSLSRRSTVAKLLEGMGSDVQEAEKPATVLKK